MTYEEALRKHKTGMCLCRTVKQFEYYTTVHIALQKQIPMKPLHMNKNYYCPNCKKDGWMLWDDAVPNDKDKFCGKCGQAIDWSEE